jgi:predicted metal-dependent peptidase
MDVYEKLSTARYQLWMKYPFFGYLALNLKFHEREDGGGCGTAAVDERGNFYFNPKWIGGLNEVDVAIVLTHEVLHLVQACHSRFPLGANHKIWNLAADVVVNSMIMESGIDLSKSELIPEVLPLELYNKYKGKVTEEVYIQMMQEGKDKEDGNCGHCDGKGFPGGENESGEGKKCDQHKDNSWGCPSGAHQEENKTSRSVNDWVRKTIEAKEFSEGRAGNKGSIPGILQDFLAKLTRPTVTWKDKLRSAGSSRFKGRYTWSTPGRRSSAIGMRLQARKPTPKGAVVFIDTSGSISQSYINQFLTETMSIIKATGAPWVHIFFHDIECYAHEKYTPRTLGKIKVKRGGTSHIPVFQALKDSKEKAGMVICFTDLMSEFPDNDWVKKNIGAPVIWAVPTAYKDHDHPFGKKIVVQI